MESPPQFRESNSNARRCSQVSSVIARFSHKNRQTNCNDFVDNIEIEFDSETENDQEESDKGLMEALVEHIELNAKMMEEEVNNQFDMLVLALNERRKELLLQVTNEKERKINRLRNKRRRYARSFSRDTWNENIGQLYRSSDDSVLNTKRDARTVENLGLLQCGDLNLVCEPTIQEMLKDFGKIESSLASGLHSEAMGFGLHYSFVGEEASFQVVTRNNKMDQVFGNEDSIKIVIKRPNDQVTTAVINTKSNGLHTVKYTPVVMGQHRIHVFVNRFELLESPFSCEALSKESLLFEQASNDVFSGSDDDWVLNKEETSAILDNNDQSGALIFGTRSFSAGKHGWKVKFTSACTGVDISIGVSQKTRIVDIDTQHTCKFRLNQSTKGNLLSPMWRQSTAQKKLQRKISTFHRETRTFFVLLDMDEILLTIICCETDERKHVRIPKRTELYPCVYMVHQCKQKVCPRPLVAFS